MKIIPLFSGLCLLISVAFAPCAAVAAGEAERNPPPVVSQTTLGENACGPCAVVNALLRTQAPYRKVLDSLPGEKPLDKAQELIRWFSQRPSDAYPGEKAYQPERGITWVDMTASFNELLRSQNVPLLEGTYLDRKRDEDLSVHLERVHALLATSIRKGVPVVISVRSFAPVQEKGEYVWSGFTGHYVTVTAVQERIDDEEKGFRFSYTDSFTGKVETGYAHIDEARNFSAAKGDAKRWEWLPNRPFLLVTAPSLRLSTQNQPWHLRTIIILNYAVYAP